MCTHKSFIDALLRYLLQQKKMKQSRGNSLWNYIFFLHSFRHNKQCLCTLYTWMKGTATEQKVKREEEKKKKTTYKSPIYEIYALALSFIPLRCYTICHYWRTTMPMMMLPPRCLRTTPQSLTIFLIPSFLPLFPYFLSVRLRIIFMLMPLLLSHSFIPMEWQIIFSCLVSWFDIFPLMCMLMYWLLILFEH